MVEDFVKNHHLLYLETSAKTGKNVEEIFKTISKNLPKDSEDVQFNESLDITLEGDNKERYTIYNCC
jgi:GTPase SAR1 family protein